MRYGFERTLENTTMDQAIVENPAVKPIADEVDQRLRRVIAALGKAS